MLFLLSSDVQSGKTRWLEKLVQDLQDEGIVCAGVLAPGVWRELSDDELACAASDAGEAPSRYEKLGIDNVLLPSGERVVFGRRTDLVEAEGLLDEASQSGRAKLGWTIFDEAIATVNEHFAQLSQNSSDNGGASSFLVVDEIGRLELQHAGGLTEAMSLLRQGPTEAFPHALVVVRSWLAERAEEAFCPMWGPAVYVAPTIEGAFRIREALG